MTSDETCMGFFSRLKMFFTSRKFKAWFNWPTVSANLCTIAVAFSFSSFWQVPRDAFRYGGLMYGLLLTVALVLVALPTTVLQLTIGQLGQQDAVGVWRAVPFFKGVGYIRLLISMLALVYTGVYVALSCTHLLYTINNSVPFWECQYTVIPDDAHSYIANATNCFNETFLPVVREKPEYYVAVSLIVIVLSMLLPFVLFGPFKIMKCTFYVLGPVVFVLAIVIISCIGDDIGLSTLYNHADVQNMLSLNMWQSALMQALLTSQTANGYLILAADSIYMKMDIQWTSYTITGANIIACWFGLMFWYSISYVVDRDTSAVAILVETYKAAVLRELNTVWPMLIFTLLLLSGIVTMLTLLYPVFEHCRRSGGSKWRYIAIACTVISVAGALAALISGVTTLSAIEDVIVPLLISFVIIAEALAFLLIYGRKKLMDDVEFLNGTTLRRYLLVGWFVAPCTVLAFTIWWVTTWLVDDAKWHNSPREAFLIVFTSSMAGLIFIIFAAVSVGKQMQYDVISKLQASFRPSRHWGPRDPLVHFYWLTRHEEPERSLSLPSYSRQLTQFPSDESIANISISIDTVSSIDLNTMHSQTIKRSNSDNCLYIVHRRQYLEENNPEIRKGIRMRSTSMEFSTVEGTNCVIHVPEETNFAAVLDLSLL